LRSSSYPAFGLLRNVVLPASAPIVATTIIVLFVLDRNQLIPLVMTGINVRTLPVILTDFFTLERFSLTGRSLAR
jgi:ABC-type glycerol-3-phosphate transport system permease component